MQVPRTHREEHGLVDGQNHARPSMPIGPEHVIGSALDPSGGFHRADDDNPYLDIFNVQNWMLDRIHELVEEISNRFSPGNVFTVPASAIVAADGTATLSFDAIPPGSFWYVDRIAIAGTPAANFQLYDSTVATMGAFRDAGVINAQGFGVLIEASPIVLTSGESLLIRVAAATVGTQIFANAQIRQFQR